MLLQRIFTLRKRLEALEGRSTPDPEAVRALLANEERYQAIVEDQTELICRFRPDGRLTFVNPAYCKYYEASSGDLVGARFMDRVIPEDVSKVTQHLASLGKIKSVGRIQHRVVCPRGKLRWQEWVSRAILDEAGGILEFQAVGRDVTDMKTAVKFLQRTEKKYRTIFNNSPLGVYRSSLDGKLLEANPALAAMLGYSRPSELLKAVDSIGEDIYESPLLREKTIEKVKATGGLHVVEAVLRRKDGSRFTGRIYMSGVRDEDGAILFLEGLIDDVTERRRMEEDLRRSERTASALLDAGMDAAYLLDADGVILAANKQGAERFDLSRRDIAGKSVAELLPRDVFLDRMEKLRQVFREKEPVRYVDERPSGVLDIQLTPVFESAGNVDKAAVFIRDITDQTRLARLREDVDRFTRHDMKTPLIGIVGFADLLLQSDNLTGKQKEYLDYIKTNGVQMMDFIQKSLDLFRMEQRAYILNPAPFDFSKALSRILLDLRGLAVRKKLGVDIFFHSRPAGANDVIDLYGEEAHLRNLFANLVKNAMEAAPDNTRLSVAVSDRNGMREVEIHNQGAIPSQIRENFFERYVTCGKEGGAGLGAYIARLIARNHNGDIFCRTSDTDGTRLTVRLPRQPESL